MCLVLLDPTYNSIVERIGVILDNVISDNVESQ